MVYNRRDPPAPVANAPGFNIENYPLSDTSEGFFRKDELAYNHSFADFAKFDHTLLNEMKSTVSDASITALKSHPLYPAFEASPVGNKSLPFFNVLEALHRLGDGRSKISLFSEFMGTKQLPGQSITSYRDALQSAFDDFASALGDPTTPDTFNRGEILSMMFIANMHLAGYQFPLEQTLALYPSGRIADSKALMDRFEAYDVARIALGSADKPSAHMSYSSVASLPMVPQPPPVFPSSFAADTTTPRNRNGKKSSYTGTPCSRCLGFGWTHSATTHSTANCTLDPRSPKFDQARAAKAAAYKQNKDGKTSRASSRPASPNTHRPGPIVPARTLAPVNPWPTASANAADSSAHLAALQAAFYSAKTAEESLGYLQAMSDWKEFSLQLTTEDIQEE
jgi:hypothetical protein